MSLKIIKTFFTPLSPTVIEFDCCVGYKQDLLLDKHDAAKAKHESSIKLFKWQH